MAIIHQVKDGPSGTDRAMKIDELNLVTLSKLLIDYQCKLLGDEPTFNVEFPSDYYSKIVVEVTSRDLLNTKFPRIGFYLVEALHPNKAEFLRRLG